jgi:uncharacterized protein with HEPN domain
MRRYLKSMLIAARRVKESIEGVDFDQFVANREKCDSVILQIGNVGESANQVSSEFRKYHSEIPWTAMIKMRHRMVHRYDLINHEMVWKTATISIPALIAQLEVLVSRE